MGILQRIFRPSPARFARIMVRALRKALTRACPVIIVVACIGSCRCSSSPESVGGGRDDLSKVGDTWTNSIGMELVYIPPGTFVMGSPAEEQGRGRSGSSDETQHRVRLTKGFFMGVTEVTQAQWKAVMGTDPSRFKGDNLPVERVSWHVAVAFCRKLSASEGKQYRLPTEAEWEYACRAGTTTAFNTGPTISTDQANYDGNHTYAGGRRDVYRKKTMPVGSFKANAWGLYDMHGNVYEWCSDRHGEYPRGEAVDPTGPAKGKLRVLRGGSWYYAPWFCRSASRRRVLARQSVVWYYGVGFRLVLDLN